jgi:hypothetical protein
MGCYGAREKVGAGRIDGKGTLALETNSEVRMEGGAREERMLTFQSKYSDSTMRRWRWFGLGLSQTREDWILNAEREKRGEAGRSECLFDARDLLLAIGPC